LHALKAIEQSMGREETVRYGPRVIDLDILFYDNVILKTDALEIPHPRLAERRFVLAPLNDIAPAHMHPLLKQPVQTLLHQLNDDAEIHLYSEMLTLKDAPSSN
jgi:7,8-dihydro-6-hydroxymethylpterin-pyrophosphokinase